MKGIVNTITEDTSPMEGIRLTQKMSLDELKEAQAYLHRRRDEIIEESNIPVGINGVPLAPPQIRSIDLNLVRIQSMIGHRQDEYELHVDLPENITPIQFNKPSMRAKKDTSAEGNSA